MRVRTCSVWLEELTSRCGTFSISGIIPVVLRAHVVSVTTGGVWPRN